MLKRLAGLGLVAALGASAGPAYDAVVAFRSGSEAYEQAVTGMREALRDAAFRVQYIDLAEAKGAAEFAAARGASPKLVTMIGTGAWDPGYAGTNALPAVMLRHDTKGKGAHYAGAVYADVPLTTVAERLRELFRGKSRLGLIHRSSWTPPDAAAVARLRQSGFELRVVECPGPDALLGAFASLRGKVDFVIAEPDAELYNSVTVKPLVMASLEHRLPIVGFSAGFVRAGALVGVYPDFRELGRQTGELMGRILEGKSDREEEEVRKVVVAVNQTVARLMGISPADRTGAVIFK